MTDVYQGSCLCGALQFRLAGALQATRNCFCSNCRKFAGTSPAVWAMANTADLEIVSSDASISRFDSGQGIRCFCSTCGSPVWFESKAFPTITGIPLGVLDSGNPPQPEMNLWTDSRQSWCMINADLVNFANGPDA